MRHQTAREYENERGVTVHSMEHRAGWDATFSAPKSVSLTALVGGDDRIREAHRDSVKVALDEMEKYVQGRIGGNVPAQTTERVGRRASCPSMTAAGPLTATPPRSSIRMRSYST